MDTKDMTIGKAIANMGITVGDDEDLIIVSIPAHGGIEWGKPLDDVADMPVDRNVYYSTGTFFKGSVSTRSKGRSKENVKRVFEFPFDIDLHPYIGVDDRSDVYSMSRQEVERYCDAMWIDTSPVFASFGLVPHRVDYTGNGIAVFLRIDDNGGNVDIERVQSTHHNLVTALNARMTSHHARMVSGGDADGIPQLDTSVKDAGTRIMRIPYGVNEKVNRQTGEIITRYPRTIEINPDAPSYSIDHLARIAGGPMPRPSRPADVAGPPVRVGDDAFRNTITVGRRYWRDGQRHNMALALSAMLAKARVSQDQAERVIIAIMQDDDQPDDRLTCVATTYQRYLSGESIEGYWRLRDDLGISDADLKSVDDELSAIWRSATPPKSDLDTGFVRTPTAEKTDRDVIMESIQRARKVYPEPPIEAQYGWFGRFLNTAVASTDASRAFLLTTMMAYTGAIVGRRIQTINPEGRPLFPNMYLILVGPTNIGRKSTTMNFVMSTVPKARSTHDRSNPPSGDLLAATKVQAPSAVTVVSNIGSGPALIKTLSDADGPVLYRTDEVSDVFKVMAREGESLLDNLNQVWDARDEIRNNVKTDGSVAVNPFFSMIGASQPRELDTIVTDQHIRTGLMNRAMIVFSERMRYFETTRAIDYPALADLWDELMWNINSYASDAILQFTPDAMRAVDDYRVKIDAIVSRGKDSDDALSETEADLIGRYPIHVRKFAMMYAISDAAPIIELRHVTAAIALAEWMWEGVRRRYGSWGVSGEERAEQRIRAVLDRCPVLHIRDLRTRAKNNRQYPTRILSSVLKELSDMDVVYKSPDKYICYGHEAQRILDAYGSLEAAAKVPVDDLIRDLRSGSPA